MAKSERTQLLEYLSRHIKDAAIKNGAESYADFARRTAGDFGTELDRELEAAAIAERKSTPSATWQNDRLGELGLSDSGYADYLRRRSTDSYGKRRSEIENERARRTKSTAEKYQNYLAEREQRQTSIYNSVVRSLMSQKILDPETAYKYGLAAGLESERARAASGSAYIATRNKIKTDLLEKMYANLISPEDAYHYAEKAGLPEEDMRELAKMVSDYYEERGEISQSYLDYLESLANTHFTWERPEKG